MPALLQKKQKRALISLLGLAFTYKNQFLYDFLAQNILYVCCSSPSFYCQFQALLFGFVLNQVQFVFCE
ncbi:hypothetical protein NBRC116188_29510 [Oceaniserpentilla sp. 4NH20-0058]